MAHLELLAVQASRAMRNFAFRWERSTKQWAQTRPYALLAAFPIWGNPKSFPVAPKARVKDAIQEALRGSWALVAVAVAPWTVAYVQFQSMFLEMIEDKLVVEAGRIAFEKITTWLEISSWIFPVLAYFAILAISLVSALVYQVEMVITHLDWRARPRVGYRFHLTQVASVALYCGLPVQAISWILNHRSFAEPWIQVIVSSPLMLIPACLWLIGRRLRDRNRESADRALYGSSRRALAASTLSTIALLGVLVAWKLSLH